MRKKFPKNISEKLGYHNGDLYLIYIRTSSISPFLKDWLEELNDERTLDDFQQDGFYIYAATCTKKGMELFLETRKRELFVVVKFDQHKIRTDVSIFQRFFNFWICLENYATRNRNVKEYEKLEYLDVPFLSAHHESSYISMFMEGFEDLMQDPDYETALRLCLATPRFLKPKFVNILKDIGFYRLLEFCSFLIYGVDIPPDATFTLDEISVLFQYFGETISL